MPSKEQRQRAYIRAIRDLIERRGALEGAEVREARKLLKNVQKAVSAELRGAPTEFTEEWGARMGRALDGAFGEFAAKYGKSVSAAAGKTAEEAAEGLARAVKGLGLEVGPLPRISLAQVEAAQAVTVDWIKSVSAERAAKVAGQIRTAMLGGMTPSDLINAIVPSVKGSKTLREALNAAEMIARTQLNQGNQLGGQLRMAQMARKADIQKQWLASFVQRQAHIDADGQTVPVDKPFIVDKEPLMFPADPAGSPGNVINCGCVSVPYVPALEEATREIVQAQACLTHGRPAARAA
ncbi:MAG: hypothetical protein HY618_00940 [Candidatus Tectomicrobia bacterium]|uniref:Phage head morphogenesis domain-containing protein n=1 Tax=Tectimicrobiota bacterium TaxID=2528274 RepID=A0A932ZUV9_UNCTE|nr:hypothetical protein [Candidatus Tectomicrobia bacterium]